MQDGAPHRTTAAYQQPPFAERQGSPHMSSGTPMRHLAFSKESVILLDNRIDNVLFCLFGRNTHSEPAKHHCVLLRYRSRTMHLLHFHFTIIQVGVTVLSATASALGCLAKRLSYMASNLSVFNLNLPRFMLAHPALRVHPSTQEVAA